MEEKSDYILCPDDNSVKIVTDFFKALEQADFFKSITPSNEFEEERTEYWREIYKRLAFLKVKELNKENILNYTSEEIILYLEFFKNQIENEIEYSDEEINIINRNITFLEKKQCKK